MKHIKTSNLLLLIVLVIIAGEKATGQTGGQHETVTVLGAYTPQLSEARKIGFTPELKDTVIPVPKIEYKIVSIPVDLQFNVKAIPPAKMVGETFNKLHKNHIIAGFGNYGSPLIDISHHSYRSKKLRGEIHMKHFSAGGNIENYPHPGFSENTIGVSGHFIQPQYTISTGMDYHRDAIRYYGFQIDSLTPDFEKNDIRQVFKKLDFFFMGESNYKQRDKFHNLFALKYQGLWDEYNVNEQNILFEGQLKKHIDLFRFLKEETIFVDAHGGFFAQDYALQSISTGIVNIKPYLNVKRDELELTVGGKISAQLDSIGEIHFFPYGQLDIHIVPGALKIFLGIDGAIERTTFRQLSDVNPFINTEILPMEFTISENILYGGISGGFGGKYNYRFSARNSQNKNMPLFINDTLGFYKDTLLLATGNRFGLVYDNVDILSVSLELMMDFSRKFSAEIYSAYNIFSPETQAKAWHLPKYEGSLGIIYNLSDKIYGKLNVFAFGERYALVNDAEVKLKPIYDFNLEVEYRYTKNLSAWLRFNNFTTKRHYYWNNYPSQRLNGMIGVSYTF